MKPIAKLPKDERKRWIWEGLAAYANSSPLDEAGLSGLKKAFVQSLNETPIHIDWRDIREVDRYSEKKGVTTDESLRFWTLKYQPELRNLLTWLCLPNDKAELGSDAAKFLVAHSSGFTWVFEYANEKFDETGEDGYPIFLWPVSQGCDSIMGPICKFIVERIWKFQEGDLSLSEALPLQICEREGCGKFTLPERQGRKRFCSDQCRALAFQHSRNDWNEYMRKYRKDREERAKKKALRGKR